MTSKATATDVSDLSADAAQVLASAPAPDAAARFERLAWSALLSQFGDELLTRDCQPAHLTASAAVLDPAGESTCLVFHHKLQRWVQPGGHVEASDTGLAAAAAREVREETGLSGVVLPVPVLLSRHRAPCAPGLVDWHLDVQFLLISEQTQPVTSDESPKVSWWPVDHLPDELAPGVADLVVQAAALVRTSSARV